MHLDHADLRIAAPSLTRLPAMPAPRRRRIDGFDLTVLAVFAGVSVWVLGLDLWQVLAHGRVWTRTDGFYVIDQMQYLAWISDASRHFLVSNLFVLHRTPADYFQPAIAISGLISALGVAPWLVYLLWKPVAVAAFFFAARAYTRRSLAGVSARRVALVLGLFFGSFTIVYGSFGVVGDLFPGFLLWGYPFGLIAVAAMLFALLAYERGRRAERLVWAPALLGALASSLHPWQGETLILIVIAVELLMWRGGTLGRERIALPAITVIVTALPLAYYAVLGNADLSWRLARAASKHSFSLPTIAIALAPLVVPVALAYRSRPQTFIGAVTRIWPIAALVVYLLSATKLSATPLHAFVGITIPLAVLAVEGIQRAGWHRIPRARLLGALALLMATIPATAFELSSARALVTPTPGNANFITHDERQALDYLADDREPGGVLTRFYLGAVVPAETGRRTFVGHCLWSAPDCTRRSKIAQALFDGSLTPRAARSLVLASGARFVLSDCTTSADLLSALAPITSSVQRFGCAGVYSISPAAPSQPATQR